MKAGTDNFSPLAFASGIIVGAAKMTRLVPCFVEQQTLTALEKNTSLLSYLVDKRTLKAVRNSSRLPELEIVY